MKIVRSVLQRLHRRGQTAAAVDEDGGVALVDGHDGAVAQQTAEVEDLARFAADGRDDADGGGLAVDHADGGFVEPISRELPMEYALELNRLVELQMEGSAG